MKNFICITLFLLCYGLMAQPKSDKFFEEAQKAYKKMQYAKALELYQKALQNDTANIIIKEKIAHCYRKLQDSENAEIWYAKVVHSPITDPEDKIYYAQALANNNKHAEAQLWYNAYAKQVKDDSRALSFSLAYQNLQDFYKDSLNYEIRLAPFNSTECDFSPVYCGNTIVFASNRNYQSKTLFQWDNSPFVELFMYEKKKVKPFPLAQKTNYHEGPACFSPKGDTLIYTRNSQKKGKPTNDAKMPASGSKFNRLKIYFAYKQPNGTWGKEEEFPHNSADFSTMHPALSPDGKILYFVSDRTGGQGGMDLWLSRYENGKWSEPENLGETFNTRGHEVFPFVDSKGNLYFASNGHGGLGGLDIFMAENVGGKLLAPVNLGYPINSTKDDFGFYFNPKTKRGFLSSNRGDGPGKDDIYEVIARKSLSNFNEMIILTRNETNNQPVPLSEIKITTEQKTAVYFADVNGITKHFFNKRLHYQIIVNKQGFETTEITLIPEQIASHPEGDTLEIDLFPERKNITILKAVDDFSQTKVPVFMRIVNGNSKKVIHNQETDGKFEKNLDKGTYEVSIWAKGYFGDAEIVKVADKKDRTFKLFRLKPLRKNELYFTQILFEKNSDKFTTNSNLDLEVLLKTLEKNPEVTIKIIGFAQDAKQEAQNLVLAEKRAKAVLNYLIGKKIDKRRLQIQGSTEKNNGITIQVLEANDNNTEEPLKSIFDD
ncbi:MAG: OmpA family protein [Raineya sp.]|nr:OmpA family protein [Raineya sp.]